METSRASIEVWNGDWGLPSVDPHCLTVLAYCKFAKAPIDVTKTGNPWRSPTGNLPVLRHNDVVLTRMPDILNYLRKEQWGSDQELSTKQGADTVAFAAMIEEKLYPALLQLWWVDSKNFVDVTRPWYSKVIPFPLNFFLPARKQKSAELRICLTKGRECATESETETRVYKEAKECLNILSYKLGDNDFMFGRQPSALDAIVFGYLMPVLKAPLPTNQLHSHLIQCDNLCRLCNNILATFFPTELKESREKEQKEKEKKSPDSNNSNLAEFPHKRRNLILAGVFATLVMVGYAFSSGLIEIQVVDDESSSPVTNSHHKEGKQQLIS